MKASQMDWWVPCSLARAMRSSMICWLNRLLSRIGTRESVIASDRGVAIVAGRRFQPGCTQFAVT